MLSDSVGMSSATQNRFSLESLCKLTCKREAKANLTVVLPGSNCCHTFLTIPLSALASRQASPPMRVKHSRELPRRFPAAWFIPFIPVP
jgi:hypothetical protein